MLNATVVLSSRCMCSLWFVPAGVFVNGSFRCPQFIELEEKMSCTINLILCFWLWPTVGAGVCACDLYLSLNVSCESDSNMMFPTHNGGTHTQSATSTWLFAEAIGCSQSFPYPQHRQWASCAIKVWSCEWKNQAVHKEIKQIWVCNLWKACCLELPSRVCSLSTWDGLNSKWWQWGGEELHTHL